MAETAQTAPVERQRSPGFPTINLRDAIERIRVVYDADRTAPTPSEVIAGHFNQAHTSSTFQRILASLRRFGLLVDAGGHNLRVSPAAVDILLMPDENPERLKRIQAAALAPRVHQELWEEFKSNLPSDPTLIHRLVTERGFQRKSAADLISQYRETLEFAKLTGDDRITETDADKRPKVGDFVQWESQGMLRFPQPMRVREISADGTHLFVEGSMTGIPIEQTKVQNPPPGAAANSIPPHLRQPPKPPGYTPPVFSVLGSKQDVFTIESGTVVVQWPQNISAADFDDIDQWVKILLRKIKRSVAANGAGTGDGGGSGRGSGPGAGDTDGTGK
jgi:hypothetical protein